MKVFIPTNRLSTEILQDDTCSEDLTFKGCPLASDSNVCTYTCDAASFESFMTTGVCAMLYLRINSVNTGLEICEIQLA